MSTLRTVYLDNNSTTRPLPEVRDSVIEALATGYGNASSAHSGGEYARNVLSNSRQNILRLLGIDHGEIVFTGGGTESNNQVLKSILPEEKNQLHIVTTTIEHSSIIQTCEYMRKLRCKVTTIPAGRDGRVDLQALEEATCIP